MFYPYINKKNALSHLKPDIQNKISLTFYGSNPSTHTLQFFAMESLSTINKQSKHHIKTCEYKRRLLSTELGTLPTICFEIPNRNTSPTNEANAD